MAISKLAVGLVATALAGSIVVGAEKFNVQAVEDINTNVAAIEKTYKDNETKLLQKYNDLLEQATEEIATIEGEKEELLNKKTELEATVEKLEARIKYLESTTIGDLEKEIEELKEALADAESEIDWLDAELVKYDEMLEEKHAQVLELRSDIEDLKAELANVNKNLSDTEKALEEANNEIKNANTAVEELKEYTSQRVEEVGNEIVDVDSLPTLD